MDDDFYQQLQREARALLDGETNRIANAANLSALLFMRLHEVNWVGFYFLEDNELVVGPFNGKPACTRIAIGKGVCGSAVASGKTQRVADVNAIDNHIACDIASQSEIVVPLQMNGRMLGVLDIDSPVCNRFSAGDQAGLEAIANIYLESID
ncbi:MAG: GAF domain-containing protein [Gammaproteobacteria bacterium]|nr:GAF domain-containing protein [Gammaproteobacteria bacterium]